jgi:hypothetical protein
MGSPYRDKEVGVFVRFFRAPLQYAPAAASSTPVSHVESCDTKAQAH